MFGENIYRIVFIGNQSLLKKTHEKFTLERVLEKQDKIIFWNQNKNVGDTYVEWL